MSKLEQNAEQILADFKVTPKCKLLAKKYQVGLMTMWKFLKSRGIDMPRRKLTPEQEFQLTEDYKAGMSLAKLGPKYGICGDVAGDYITRMGIPHRSVPPKKIFNQNFFHVLTEDSLWVLGWMFSDGNVCKDTNSFSITVHKNDVDVLRLIGTIMGFDRIHLYFSKKTNACLFRGNSKIVHARLIELGCVPAKSLIIRYPTYFTEDWQHWAFLRGVVEGDGHLGMKSKHNRCSFGCEIASGSRPFLESIKIFLGTQNIESYVHSGKRPSNHRLIIGKREDAIKFCNGIYKNGTATHYLKRKFEIYLKMKKVSLRPKDTASIGRHAHVSGYFKSPDNRIYEVKGIKPFAREMNVPHEVFFNILKTRKYRFTSRKYGWTPPAQEQIDIAKSTNALIVKTY